MTDIVERLRQAPVDNRPATLLNEAADEIDRLRGVRRAMHDIYEIYAGSMGNIEHADGQYLVYLIREMADIAAEHKK